MGALLIQVCTAFIDPISLSAVGAALLSAFGLSAAVWGTLGAGLAAGGVGAIMALNSKLKEQGLPELNDSGDAVFICTGSGTTYNKNWLKATYCSHVVKDHQGCDVATQKYKRAGVDYKRYCAGALVNKTTTVHHYQTVWSSAKCKLAKRDHVVKDFADYKTCISKFNAIA
ncbi:hypothetical protein FBU30_009004 [Linnemannia zychae]|nr:hypothetical protein FBU30_009004 [Linnemannia zychae]